MGNVTCHRTELIWNVALSDKVPKHMHSCSPKRASVGDWTPKAGAIAAGNREVIETEAAAFRTVIVLLPCRFDCAVAQSGRAREGAGAGGNDFVSTERERERERTSSPICQSSPGSASMARRM